MAFPRKLAFAALFRGAAPELRRVLLFMVLFAVGYSDERDAEDPSGMTVKELKSELKALGATCKACTEKKDFVQKLIEARVDPKVRSRKTRSRPVSGGPLKGGGACRSKASCKEGCEICSSPASQSQKVCTAISFCSWERHSPANGNGGGQRTRRERPSHDSFERAEEGTNSPTSGGKAGASRRSTGARISKGSPPPPHPQKGRVSRGTSSLELFEVASAGNTVALREQLAQGLSVAVTDSRGATPLHYASWYGHLSTVEVLLGAGAPVDALSGDGFTSLHLAAAFGHAHVVSALLAAGATPEVRDRDGHTAHELARRGDFRGVLSLLAGETGVQAGGVRARKERKCTTRYARLGLCAPDEETRQQLEKEEEQYQLQAQRDREREGSEDRERVRNCSPEGGECARGRMVGKDVTAAAGLRVQKSQERLAYVRENGWDDLSEGGTGTITKLLGDGRRCLVAWSAGPEDEYAIGYGGLYDLVVA
jgi:hypothetical protein